MKSNQKAHIEKNHEFRRYILPKGTSFNNLTQKDCNIIMNHINSTPREILKKKTPYQAIQNILTKEELQKLGVFEINPDEVNLTKKNHQKVVNKFTTQTIDKPILLSLYGFSHVFKLINNLKTI